LIRNAITSQFYLGLERISYILYDSTFLLVGEGGYRLLLKFDYKNIYTIKYIYHHIHPQMTSTESPKIRIYGFSGKLGSGKNYVAEHIFKPTGTPIYLAFGDQLKMDLCAREHFSYDSIFHAKDHKSRIALQKYGTEMRDKYGPHIWVTYLHNWIKMHTDRGFRTFIITDLRYPNEFNWLKALGGITIRIDAPQRNLDELKKETADDPDKMKEISTHSSEIALDNYLDQFDYIINNDYGHEMSVIAELAIITKITE